MPPIGARCPGERGVVWGIRSVGRERDGARSEPSTEDRNRAGGGSREIRGVGPRISYAYRTISADELPGWGNFCRDLLHTERRDALEAQETCPMFRHGARRRGTDEVTGTSGVVAKCDHDSGERLALQHRTRVPRRELLLADPLELALRLLPARDADDLLEDLLADLIDRRSVDDAACVDVHVVSQTSIKLAVRRDLETRGWLAPVDRSASRRERADVRPAGDDAGERYGVVARRVHDDEALRRHRLRVLSHRGERRRPALRDRAERLLVERRQPARLVPGRRVVVDLGAEKRGVALPPADAFDERLADLGLRRAAREEMLGAVHLGRLAEDARSAVSDEEIGGVTERGVGRYAAIAVRTAA